MSRIRSALSRALLAASMTFGFSSTGCIAFLRDDSNAPGNVALNTPPPHLFVPQPHDDPRHPPFRYGVDTGTDPGMKGWVFHASAYVGPTIGVGERPATTGFEIGAAPFAIEKSGNFAFDALGPALGVKAVAGWNVVGFGGDDGARLGPLYAEAQGTYRVGRDLFFLRGGLGAAVNPFHAEVGPQASLCTSIHPIATEVCGRGNVYGDRVEGAVLFVWSSYMVWGWSK